MHLRVQVLGLSHVVRPKHHWAFDIAECMLSDEHLLDAFGTERLHLRARVVAESCDNLQAFERYSMAGVTNMHYHSLENLQLSDVQLVGPTCKMPGSATIMVASSCRCLGEHLHIENFCCRGLSGVCVCVCVVVCVLVCVCGDGEWWALLHEAQVLAMCVYVGDGAWVGLSARGTEVGRIVACCVEDGEHFLIVVKYQLVATLSQHSSRWTTLGATQVVWRMDEVLNCMAWKVDQCETTVIRQ